ncbi:OmpA family protein [Zunongwangia profunda]|jgi:chemotaxis protein MotB|uniref:OmpA/MotB family outer membrane protein n=2 Tax=Zunongwangia profunda TaxID=398743 RepID=D5BDC3_ZUNPS|nr:OmpA family protein [Zunongwangia profunda]MAG87617.1 cell envelope biogenesis protein OmpA [Flavobacteriaceae bacterium]MAS71674.1 cell envelope biogenesis protein OmpA [Zunongwangia sp.]ADF54829.1 OmpA/MotB family outer membrane protein [Zunongwangia profunda SM-A87]HAJ81614.1 cell envelope biogenesis protein OmpA [Zunongwangia profunda]HCV82026.1 cell envelope biogenesis protein OmpA [Zunongwangia profunda]|tara:strand:+ start:1194 stop:2144 length:951 start_codon:yes stop_codon:yes gene_type:complete
MKRTLLAISGSVLMLTSCVSSKVYKDLESRHADLKRDNRELKSELDRLKGVDEELAELKAEHESLTAERDKLKNDLASLQSNYENLKSSYDALEKNSSAAIAENSRQNRELLAQLEEKEKTLAAEQARLEKLQKDLAARSQRIDELEGLIAAKDAKMNALKDAISKALTDFEGKGLTVEQRDGKVYVSMENKLLFNSGSWAVNADGRQAVNQLGSVLAQNPDISVLIEGHTDNVPYGGNGPLKDNWDLSTKRATAIVQILRENSNIDPQNLTAAGRGEYAPVATNDTAEGKAKNRRIEVILTPKLDEVTKLLNEVD